MMTRNTLDKKKILLCLLPYWTPQVPPLGIACLKSFLQSHGYRVKIVDVNVVRECRDIYDHYFDLLRKNIAQEKRGNFYNIGHEVLQNHMMVHINCRDEADYIEAVKILVATTFHFDVDDELVHRLRKVLDDFFLWLENYSTGLLIREKPDVLGLSVYKGTVPASMFMFKLAKKILPALQTVMGGGVFAQNLAQGTPNFAFFLDKTANYIDHLIIGEGETLFLKLLEGQLSSTQRVFTLKDIDREVLDIKSAGIPDFSDLDIQFYPNIASYTSRSCPFQCNFCTETVYWGKYRKKAASKVHGELRQLYNQYHYQLFFLCDSLLNPVITELADELINSDLSLYWDGYLRVDKEACQEETVQVWRRGGFYRARLGVESGSQRMLDLMNKHANIEQVKAAIATMANAGIKTTTYWIIGYPGETEKDFQQTLDLIEELKDNIYEAECNPFGYYLSGQVNSVEWLNSKKSKLLYPEKFRDILIVQSWFLDCDPSRKELYLRLIRFTEHCQRLGIPNPYSLYDIYQADDRWKKLHKNAVPSLIEFQNKGIYIDENKKFQAFSSITPTIEDDDFGF